LPRLEPRAWGGTGDISPRVFGARVASFAPALCTGLSEPVCPSDFPGLASGCSSRRAWLQRLVAACDGAHDRLPSDDSTSALLRAEIIELRDNLFARLERLDAA